MDTSYRDETRKPTLRECSADILKSSMIPIALTVVAVGIAIAVAAN